MKIQDVLDELRIATKSVGQHQHATSGWTQTDCPWCSKGWQHFRMGFADSGRGCSCWHCGKQKVAESLVELSGESWDKVLSLLKEIVDVPTNHQEPTKRGKLVIPRGVGPLGYAHRKYLSGRGIDPDYAERVWGVRGIGISSRLAWRLWLPIVFGGRIVSWTTRAIGEAAERRYVNASLEEEERPTTDVLAGFDMVRHVVIVVEGLFDAMRIGPGAVPTLGLQFSTTQIALLARCPLRVVVLDSEPQAQKRAKELCRQLEGFPGTTLRIELDGKDAGEAAEDELTELRKLLE